jgi:hypothetical protein
MAPCAGQGRTGHPWSTSRWRAIAPSVGNPPVSDRVWLAPFRRSRAYRGVCGGLRVLAAAEADGLPPRRALVGAAPPLVLPRHLGVPAKTRPPPHSHAPPGNHAPTSAVHTPRCSRQQRPGRVLGQVGTSNWRILVPGWMRLRGGMPHWRKQERATTPHDRNTTRAVS